MEFPLILNDFYLHCIQKTPYTKHENETKQPLELQRLVIFQWFILLFI